MKSETMLRLAAKALASGGELVTRKRVEWDIAGNCTSPVGRDITLKAVGEQRRIVGMTSWVNYKRLSGVVRTTRPPRDKVLPLGFTVGLTLRCRKCKRCRYMRQLLWSQRAKNEIAGSLRTWFGTMTLRPELQYEYLCRARARENKQGIDFDMLPYGEQFALRVQAIGPEISQYLDRVRKNRGPFRYLWVSEAHKSGDPHFHALVHEIGDTITHSVLSSQWGLGFSKWKLVSSLEQGTYLTKYLGKTTATRVRASLSYGSTSLDIAQLVDVGRDLQMSNADPPNLLPSAYADENDYGDKMIEGLHGLPWDRL